MNVKTNGTSAYALYIEDGSQSFTITDSMLNASKSGVQELYIENNVTGGVWNFTNVTDLSRNLITINWSAGGNGTLNMHWYLDVYVRNSTNGLVGANVTSYNNQSLFAFSENTGSNGRITKKTLLEYSKENNTLTIMYSPYNMSIKLDGYPSYYNSSINLSNNVFMEINLPCVCPSDSDWIVRDRCSLSNSTCNMPTYKVICLGTGSLMMANYTIIADKAITPVNHGCIFIDDTSKLAVTS